MECIFHVTKMRNLWLCSMDASGLIRSNLWGGGCENHIILLGIERKYLPVKRGVLLVQHYDHDLDVLRYHGRPDSS